MGKIKEMKVDEVILYSNAINEQKQFYHAVLGLELLIDEESQVAFKIGRSILRFIYRKRFYPSHVAFNIPFAAVEEAKSWLEQRVFILKFEGKPISEFVNWKARAIYFHDHDKNIIEFIGRKRIKAEYKPPFIISDLLSISEVALASENIETSYRTLNAMKPLPLFFGDFNSFCAAGDDEGLFILVDKNRKLWYPTMTPVYKADFGVRGDYNFNYEAGKIKELL